MTALSPRPIQHSAKQSSFWGRDAFVLYGIALLAACVITFGSKGAFVSVPVVMFWGWVLGDDADREFLARVFSAIVILLVLSAVVYFFLPAVQTRGRSPRSHCKGNLKQIGVALHNYHEYHDCFPPASLASESGGPVHSWRISLAPYLDHKFVHENYAFDEAWDSPGNRELANAISIYHCPSREGGYKRAALTSYVAVLGDDTAWPDSKVRSIRDGTSNTILLMETHSEEIRWKEPRDLMLDDALDLLSSDKEEPPHPCRPDAFFWIYHGGRHVLFGDGSVRFIPNGLRRDLWSAMLTIDGGKPEIDWEEVAPRVPRKRQLKAGNCYRFAVFVFLVLLPTPWAVRKREPRDEPAVS